MEKFEEIKRKYFLREVGIEREDFITVLLDIEEYLEEVLCKNPLKKRGLKPEFSLPDKVLLCFFIYAITTLFPN